MSDIVVTQHRFPTHGTTIATLDRAFDEQGSVVLSDTGAGRITLPRDDPLLADLRMNDLLRFWIDGSCVHAVIVERLEDHTLDEAGGARQVTVASGRGVGAILEWGVVGPANGFGASPIERDRLRSWPAPDYDHSDWDFAVLTGVAAVPAEFPALAGGPWMSGPSATGTTAPAGPTYFRDTFTLADDVEATLFTAADNWGRGYIDGQEVVAIGGPGHDTYRRTYTEVLELSAGTHTAAARLFNKGSDNPSGIRWLLATLDSNGNIDTVLHQSSADWAALETPASAPGMTPGQAFLLPIGEVKDRGALTWLTVDWDEELDSDGVPWPVVGDISTRTGNDLLTFASELSATYIDWRIDPVTLVHSMWIKGTQGGPSGVTLAPAPVTDPTTGNLVELDRIRT